jgi:hypothetical protein
MWRLARWREGKAIRVSAHGNEAEALKAAGLSE